MPAAASPGPPLRAFATLWFCYFGAMGLFNPYAALWFKDLGFSTLAIGTLASLQAWTRVLAPYGWGWLGDHSGRRVQLLRVAALASLLAAAGLLWAEGYALVATCVIVLFMANGGVVPLAEASLARLLQTASGLDTARYGRVRVWGSLGFVAAVLLFGLVLDGAGIAFFPWAVVLGYGLLLAAALRLPVVTEAAHDRSQTPPALAVLRRPEVAWFFLSAFFTVLAHTAQYVFFALYLDEHGHGKSSVGLLWAVAAGLEVAFFWWQGRVFAWLSPLGWLQWAAALAALRFAGTALLGGSLPALMLLQLTHVVSFAAHHAACIALLARYFPGALRGRGQALYTVLGYGASGVIGGVSGGWLGSRLGFDAVFWAAAGMALLGWFCAARSHRMASADAESKSNVT